VSSATISGNTVSGNADNVYLADGKKINVQAPLNNGAPIGVSMAAPGTFTDGYVTAMKDASDKGTPSTFFTSDNDTYGVTLDDNGEARMDRAYSVTVTESEMPLKPDSDGRIIIPTQADKDRVAAGDTVTLNTVIPVSGVRTAKATVTYTLNGKEETLIAEGTYDTFTFTMPAADVTVTVEAVQAYKVVVHPGVGGAISTNVENAYEGQTITLTLSALDNYVPAAPMVTYRVGDDDIEVALTKVDDTHYTFVMPKFEVHVLSNFRAQLTVLFDPDNGTEGERFYQPVLSGDKAEKPDAP